ncbi:MAG: hypothetical protein KAG97_02210 [Victivallales bacterium]|nr:hypothetical protein [Victivallales bacterium]
MQTLKKAGLEKYLKRNPVDRPLERADGVRTRPNSTRFAVVIPVFSELNSLPLTLESLFASFAAAEKELSRNSRIVVVVNNPPSIKGEVQSATAGIVENQELLARLRNSRLLRECDSCQRMEHPSAFEWIDASSPGKEINPKHGVGMARRIGINAILADLDWNADPIVCSLDADTLVDENYVARIAEYFERHPEIPGASIAFQHQNGDSPEQERAIRRYETYLRSYVAGLKRANSPYAYQFIGSAMTFRAAAYLKAGGMPARPAGEDFYFMQALRKTVAKPGEWIGCVEETTVRPSPRLSDRVAFGTGRRVEALMNSEIGDSDERLPGGKPYSPEAFEALTEVLATAKTALLHHGAASFLETIQKKSAKFFENRDFREIWPSIVENTPDSAEKLEWAFHTWFDALRTLQFIHA